MWSARVTNIVSSEETAQLFIVVAIENRDEQGAVIESFQEQWAYRIAQAPTPETIGERLRAAAERKSKLAGARDPLLLMVGQEVAVSDTPPIFPEDIKTVSQTDKAMIDLKNAVKPEAVTFIKTNPEGTTQGLYDHVLALMGEQAAHMALALIPIYVGGAFGAGLIPENTWEAFRAFIYVTPIEQLMMI